MVTSPRNPGDLGSVRYGSLLGAVVAASLHQPTPARATEFEACEKTEIEEIELAVARAVDMAAVAAAGVRDDASFGRWFGVYSPRNADTVRATLKAIHGALRDETLAVTCVNQGSEGCKGGT